MKWEATPPAQSIYFSALWVRQEPLSPQYTLYSCQDNVDCSDLWSNLIIMSSESLSSLLASAEQRPLFISALLPDCVAVTRMLGHAQRVLIASCCSAAQL